MKTIEEMAEDLRRLSDQAFASGEHDNALAYAIQRDRLLDSVRGQVGGQTGETKD